MIIMLGVAGDRFAPQLRHTKDKKWYWRQEKKEVSVRDIYVIELMFSVSKRDKASLFFIISCQLLK